MRCLRFQWSLSIDLVTRVVRFAVWQLFVVPSELYYVIFQPISLIVNKQFIFIFSALLYCHSTMMNMRILLNREPVNCKAPESWEKISNKRFLHSSIYIRYYYVNTRLRNDSIIFFAFKFAHNSFVTFIHKWQTTLNGCGSYMFHMCVHLIWFFSFRNSIWYAKLQTLRLEYSSIYFQMSTFKWHVEFSELKLIAVLRLCYWYMQ